MKKIFYILLPVLLLSCDNMLDEVPKNFVSRSNYYQTEADAQGAINGAYSAIGPDFFGITYYLLIELHGDFLNGRGSQAPISLVDRVLDQQNIGRANTSWSAIYTAINRTNAVLDNVPGITNMNEEVKTRILAEAHFLRALCYFELVRGWGAVPLRTKESTDLSELSMVRAPEADVYALIVEDLVAAEQGLPISVGTEKGRASVWAAKMLLAHVYLTTGDYAAAAEKADDVITSGNFSLVEVQSPDDFYDIFAADNSTEEIMSVKHSPNRQSDLPLYLHMAGNRPYNYSTSGFFGWIPDRNSFLGASWNDSDLRKNFNLYTQYQNAAGQWVSLPGTTPVLFKKYITTPEALRVYSAPIYRYAEALLFYAEASARAEGAPSALALERLNMVKRRAYGYDPDIASPVDYAAGMNEDAFVDAVLQERAYEFMLERRRYFDLKRTGKVKEAFAAVGKTFIDQRFLFPIPENEINNNPALSQSDQNPGY
jgi:starch-binding outer membrane protein, SusD/RagB family